jgi:His/Glu/Gln/Arg/opine family amino acid ABC transporter permease subunit
MSCWDTVADYGLRAIGIGLRGLPKTDFTLCQQVTLIGSGMIWNVYFGVISLFVGFFFAISLALGKFSDRWWLRLPADWFVFIFRGSPLFIQLFFAYFLFLSLKKHYLFFDPFTAAWLGALIVLVCNTAAYSASIFHGALLSIPKGDIEAADAYGLSGWTRFRKIIWPTMLRLGWPAYTQ